MAELAPENVRIDEFGCWIWLGPLSNKGYGPHWRFYTAATGLEPRAGLQLDHICRRRACVNWLHHDPVAVGENQRRRSRRGREGIQRCPQDHRIVPGSTIATPEGGYVCRVCMETNAQG